MPDSLDSWLADHALTPQILEKWGVVVYHNYFRVPVYSLTGKRVFWLKRNFYGEQKYNVEPQGAKRGFQLYGLWETLKFINAHRIVVCVEGFSDFLAIFPAVTVACSVLGSRITQVQLELLKCFAQTIILWSDGDETGENAARGLLNDKKNPGVRTFGLVIDGLDPAAYVQRGGDADVVVAAALRLAKQYSFAKFDSDLHVLERVER